jgi:hypothetical protein
VLMEEKAEGKRRARVGQWLLLWLRLLLLLLLFLFPQQLRQH